MLIDSKIESLISELASDSDNFGGGAVGGIVAAMGIGLILMSIKISTKRKNFKVQPQKVKDEVTKYIKTLEISLLGAKATVEADALAFQDYMKAYRDKVVNLEPQSIACFNVPKQLADVCVAALSTSHELQPYISGSIKADLDMGQDLLKVVIKSALRNMEINLKQIKKDSKHQEYKSLINDAKKLGVSLWKVQLSTFRLPNNTN